MSSNVTLHREGNPLADPAKQLIVLRPRPQHKLFEAASAEAGLYPLRALGIDVLQVNLGKLCNMTCSHCHVDAGPERREIMTRETAEACVRALAATDVPTLDLTGGAPEMNPNFRWMVEEARGLGRHIIDRCNLTILHTPGHTDLPEFLAAQRVEIVASLPCYLETNVDAQRGSHAFERSIDVLRQLNDLGYGQPDSGLQLTLVYNPVGAGLPPPQDQLEQDYRRELAGRYGVVFSRLFTITNMPVGRFLNYLLKTGTLDDYLEKLIGAYNPAAAAGVMCRTTLSVDWEGQLYDCDFNQMLGLRVHHSLPQNIRDLDPERLTHRIITTGQHCYGCTAGDGSSCLGVIAG
ncbi:MAG TPA: arsenosugar biosynthesis radical SAM (seleno)protein ArsS [Thermoguttaceae bacterium]|nr:arsenosugar biosynthesis radical SAM (seleno)protein ArsS [Thermoguttaceae bacterium]